MKDGTWPPFFEGGVTKAELEVAKRPELLLDGVNDVGGVLGENERSEVARGIDDGDAAVLLAGRELLSEVDGDEVVGGEIGSTNLG